MLNAGGDWSLQKTVTVTHSVQDGTGDSTVNDKHLYSCISWWDLKASEVLDMGVMNEQSQLDLDMHYHNLTF